MKSQPILLLAAILLGAGPATAQGMNDAAASQACPAVPVPPPAELAGWAARTSLTAAATPVGLAAATLVVGKGVDAALSRTGDITYVADPEKPGGSVSYGGMFTLDAARAGTYRIAIGSGAWIDVLKDKTSLRSVAHGHGPACTGVRKMVDFALTPGRYVIEIAANGTPALPLLVTLLP